MPQTVLVRTEKQPKDFALQKGANLSERKQNFAKSTQRSRVGNRTFPTGYENKCESSAFEEPI
ncbi:hypothetical protein [Desulfitobacterium hafniense]|uniref:hypothetical protein n=1 Tax=Desulfitobacterium hafniense TaxID=49338 RepID=UPI000380962A|nr:hypothetical protein [Desulfitobacterium hafniense]